MELTPELVRAMARPEDRKRYGARLHPNALLTYEQCEDKAALKLEREDHKRFISFLERNDYAYAHNRMDRKSTTKRGVPDFIVGLAVGLAIEFKVGYNKLSDEQEEWARRHVLKGGKYHIASSYQEGIAIVLFYDPPGA